MQVKLTDLLTRKNSSMNVSLTYLGNGKRVANWYLTFKDFN